MNFATFTRLHDETWGVRVPLPEPLDFFDHADERCGPPRGTQVEVHKRDGSRALVRVDHGQVDTDGTHSLHRVLVTCPQCHRAHSERPKHDVHPALCIECWRAWRSERAESELQSDDADELYDPYEFVGR